METKVHCPNHLFINSTYYMHSWAGWWVPIPLAKTSHNDLSTSFYVYIWSTSKEVQTSTELRLEHSHLQTSPDRIGISLSKWAVEYLCLRKRMVDLMLRCCPIIQTSCQGITCCKEGCRIFQGPLKADMYSGVSKITTKTPIFIFNLVNEFDDSYTHDENPKPWNNTDPPSKWSHMTGGEVSSKGVAVLTKHHKMVGLSVWYE